MRKNARVPQDGHEGSETASSAGVAMRIEGSIVLIRGHRVLLDDALAALYGVPVKVLNQTVKRNAERFPEDFMFQLTAEESDSLRSRSVTSKNAGRGGRRYEPYAFMEQGVAMLSGVLRSERAVSVNIEIMRAFVRMRRVLREHADLAQKLVHLEKRYDAQFRVVFDAIRDLMEPPPKPRERIGFRGEEEGR